MPVFPASAFPAHIAPYFVSEEGTGEYIVLTFVVPVGYLDRDCVSGYDDATETMRVRFLFALRSIDPRIRFLDAIPNGPDCEAWQFDWRDERF